MVLSWIAVAGAVAQVALAMLWHDDLAEASGPMLALHYLAFMARVFLFHAGVAMVFVIACALLMRRHRLGIAACVPAMVVGLPLVPTVFHGRSGVTSSASDELSIFSCNVMYGAADGALVLDRVKACQPDVIVIQEWSPVARRKLLPLFEESYSYRVEESRDDAFGQAVFSRRPFTGPVLMYPPRTSAGVPEITVSVDVGGKPMRVTCVHLLAPVTLSGFAEQREGAAVLSKWARSTDPARPQVLIGDFNAPLGTSIISAFIGDGWREAHAEVGFGRGSTWPSTGKFRFFPGIRIDNAIVGPRVRAIETRVLEPVLSDHLPIFVRLRWAE